MRTRARATVNTMTIMITSPLGDVGPIIGMPVPVIEVVIVKVEVVEAVRKLADDVTVDTKVVVAEFIIVPPTGVNRSIVESSWGGTSGGSGGDPTIHPLVGDNMNTEFRIGGIIGSPSRDGARVICVQAAPSQ